MVKAIQITVLVILTSLFYFPIELVGLPGLNSKMILALLGLVFAGYEQLGRRSLSISRAFLSLILVAASVSLVSLLSITLNQTPDTSYVSYVVSFSVWLSGAYAVCFLIRSVHGAVSVRLVIDYLTVVCVLQCVSAIMIDNNPGLAESVNSLISFGQDVPIRTKRLYGFGSMLDIAGTRFSVVLVGIGYYLSEMKHRLTLGRRILYLVAFFVITVIGNMIARTTLVGSVIGLALIIVSFIFVPSLSGDNNKTVSFLTWTSVLAVGIVICVILYNNDPAARKLFRFGFEGFFSLAEKGHWETSSTDKLTQTMIVFPETIHTWIIGDGYFANSMLDVNYLGDATTKGYYMGTDVGYLRFIFYFGVIGLASIMWVIIYSAVICMRSFCEESPLFLFSLLVGLIIWLKVSTDIFCFLSLFLSTAALQDAIVEPQTSENA